MKQTALLLARVLGTLAGVWGLATLWSTVAGFTAALENGTIGQARVPLLVAYFAAIAASLLVCWAAWRRLTPPIVNGLAFFAGLFLWMWLRGQKWMFESLAGLHASLPAIVAPLLGLALAWFLSSWLRHALFRKEPEMAPAAEAAEE